MIILDFQTFKKKDHHQKSVYKGEGKQGTLRCKDN